METKPLTLSENSDTKIRAIKEVLKLPSSCSSDLGDPLGFESPASCADTAGIVLQSAKQCHLLLSLPLKAPQLNSYC